MQYEILHKLAGRLLPGERILWAGRPGQGLIFTAADIPITLFFLFWAGLPAFGAVSEGFGKGNWHVPVFTLPFLVIGAYMLVGRHFYDAWLRARTFYAVTDRRVLIWREAAGPWCSFMALDRARIDAMEWKGSPTCGTIYFAGSPAAQPGNFKVSGTTLGDLRPQFFRIEEPERVFQLLQRPGETAASSGLRAVEDALDADSATRW